MPFSLAVDDVYQVRLYTTLGNQCAINRFYLEVNSIAPPAPDDHELAVQVDVDIATLWKDLFINVAIYNGLQVQRVRPLPMPVAQSSTGNAGAGSRAGNPVPGNVAAIGKWLTPMSGRKNRGRIYIPFLSGSDTSGFNTVGGLERTRILAFLNAVVAGFTIASGGGGNAGLSPVLFHPDRTSTPITGTGVDPLTASMRRRGGTGRPNSSPI